MNCEYSPLPGGCGVNNYAFFDKYYADSDIHTVPSGAASLAVASFIDTVVCRKAYTILASRFKIAYQSSVRKNKNSGNDFFFVVYDGLKEH